MSDDENAPSDATGPTADGPFEKAALIYASGGWAVLPDEPNGKRPILKGWQNEATTDLTTIAQWVEKYPRANIGVATGSKSGFFVLDVDPRNGGRESMARLIAKHGPLPRTVEARTGSGGSHYLFKLPDFLVGNSSGTIAPGVDIKGEAGQIVVAPSVTAQGAYQWVIPPWECEPGDAGWLLSLIAAPKAELATVERVEFPPAPPAIVEQARRYLAKVPPAVSGQGGHKATFLAAQHVVLGFKLSDEQAFDVLGEWNERCEPQWSTDELEHKVIEARVKGTTVAVGEHLPDVERPVIQLQVDEHIANEAAARALATHKDVFQAERYLVTVDTAGCLKPIDKPVVRHMLTQVACFERYDGRSEDFVRCTPSDNLVAYLASPGTVRDARRVDNVILAPTMRPDGSLILAPGYDAATRTFHVKTCDVPPVADRPSAADVRAALEIVRKPFVDFPFDTEVDRSAMLALTVTPFIRPAISGQLPAGVIEANIRGAGKTRLADIIGRTFLGRSLERTTWPVGDEPEQRKQITTLLRSRKPLALWDNCEGTFGGPALNQLLTSELWSDRLLSLNDEVMLPNRTLWLVTMNNAQLAEDVARRCVIVRLVSPDARPEDRTGFAIENVDQWVLQNRGRLIHGWLTLLRAFHVAKRPSQGLRSLGSFEEWSNMVRNCMVWLGLPDPLERAVEFAERSDTHASAHERLVAGLTALLGDRALSAGEILMELGLQLHQHEGLKAALVELSPPRGGDPLPTTQGLGRALTKLRQRRTLGGAFIDSYRDAHTKNFRWRVVKSAVTAVSAVSVPIESLETGNV